MDTNLTISENDISPIELGTLDVEEIRKEITGNTLKVYLLFVRNQDKKFGVREIYRQLNFSSVSLASYHLNKLETNHLIRKTPTGKYIVDQLLPLGDFEEFFVLKGKYLPKEAFFLAFSSSSLLVAVLFFLFRFYSPMLILLLGNAIISTIYSFYRFYSIYQNKDEEIIQ